MANSLAYLVPFSHLDLYWLGEREECLSRGLLPQRFIRGNLLGHLH